MVARLGADEFAIILGDPAPSLADADAFARRLLQLAVSPVIIGEQRIRLSANHRLHGHDRRASQRG